MFFEITSLAWLIFYLKICQNHFKDFEEKGIDFGSFDIAIANL